jgi:Tol biopolymer transport system component
MAGWERNPSIAGNVIAFESRASQFDTADIFVYDMTTNRVFQITNTPGVDKELNDITVLPDGSVRVVWASTEDGYDARNVHGATFQLPHAGTSVPSAMQPPINPDGSSTFKLGQTIPVRITATDQSGRPVDGLAPQLALALMGAGATDVNEVVMSGSADTGTTMRGLGGGAYIFNLSTKRSQFNAGQDLTDGRYRLTISEPTFTVPLVTEFGLRR